MRGVLSRTFRGDRCHIEASHFRRAVEGEGWEINEMRAGGTWSIDKDGTVLAYPADADISITKGGVRTYSRPSMVLHPVPESALVVIWEINDPNMLFTANELALGDEIEFVDCSWLTGERRR